MSIVGMGESVEGLLVAALEATQLLSTDERAAMGMVVGTTLGCLEMDREFDESRREVDGRYASPAAFSRTLPSSIVSEAALKLGVKGPTVIICERTFSTAIAIRRGESWMRHMHLSHCLVGGVDGKTAALILLGKKNSALRVVIGRQEKFNWGLQQDRSLRTLIQFIQNWGSREMGRGVRLVSDDR